MRRHPDHLPPPPGVLTLGALRQVQLQIAELGSPVTARVDLPLARAAGRVLADDFRADTRAAAPLLPRGTRLAARHLPLLAGSGHTTASVLARPRVGVMALAGDAAEVSPVRARTGALASAAWTMATLERLGAQPFEATCRCACPRRFVSKLEMFVGECELVLVLGFLTPELCAAVAEAQERRGQAPRVETLRPRPFGALQILQVGPTLVVALPADLDGAVAAFTTLLAPLLRHLQGRDDALPDIRAAELHVPPRRDDERWRLFPVRIDPGALNTRVRLMSSPGEDAAVALAGADGLAWHAAEFSGFERPTVAFFPFDPDAG
jgi:molybdopterin molybdotransferase